MADNTNLPRPACIVTNMGPGWPQSFMLASVYGVALAQQPKGSTLDLYTADQVRALLADRESRVPSDEREARLKAAMERLDKIGPLPGMIAAFENHFGQSWTDPDWRGEASTWAGAWARALLSRPSGEVVGTGASELLGYAPKHDDLLKGIRDNLNIMLASARTHSDGDFVSGYTIKTGALHRIIGLLQIAGFPVIVPAAPAAPASPDAEMLDWLELRDVEVRERLRYGSRRVIHALTEGDEEDGVKPSRLREAIRAAMAASKDPQA